MRSASKVQRPDLDPLRGATKSYPQPVPLRQREKNYAAMSEPSLGAPEIAPAVCAAVPTAKTVYILAGEYKVEEPLVAATVSTTMLLSVVTLLGWLYALSGLGVQAN